MANLPLEPVHDQAVAVAAEAREREQGPGHVAAQAFKLLSLPGPVGDRRVQREAVASRGERFGRLARGSVRPGTCWRSVFRPTIGPTAMR